MKHFLFYLKYRTSIRSNEEENGIGRKKKHQMFIRYMHKDSKWKIIEAILWDLTVHPVFLGTTSMAPTCPDWAPGTSYTAFVQVSLSNLFSEQDSGVWTSLKVSWRYAVEVAEHHVPCSLLTEAAIHSDWSLSATQEHVKVFYWGHGISCAKRFYSTRLPWLPGKVGYEMRWESGLHSQDWRNYIRSWLCGLK